MSNRLASLTVLDPHDDTWRKLLATACPHVRAVEGHLPAWDENYVQVRTDRSQLALADSANELVTVIDIPEDERDDLDLAVHLAICRLMAVYN